MYFYLLTPLLIPLIFSTYREKCHQATCCSERYFVCCRRVSLSDTLHSIVVSGAVLAQKFWGGGITPSAPSSPESIFSVLRNRKIRTSYGHLKPIISRVSNSVKGSTRRNEARRAESGLGFSPHQLGVLGSAVSSPSAPENWHFGAFWDLRNHVRTVS